MAKKKIFSFLFLALFFFLTQASAETFKVIYTFGTLEDESRISPQSDIKLDFSGITDDKEKAKKAVLEVLKRRTQDTDEDILSRIYYRLDSVKEKEGFWYVDYKWDFISELDFDKGIKLGHFFSARVDLKSKIITYKRDSESQFSGPPDSYLLDKYR